MVAVSVLFSLYHISGHDVALIDGAMLQNLVLSSRGDDIEVYDESFEEQIKASLSYVQSIDILERKLVFFHIPKTAGTAVEFAAGTKRIPWGSCLFNHKPKRNICQYPGEQECKGIDDDSFALQAEKMFCIFDACSLTRFNSHFARAQGRSTLDGGICQPSFSHSRTQILTKTQSSSV